MKTKPLNVIHFMKISNEFVVHGRSFYRLSFLFLLLITTNLFAQTNDQRAENMQNGLLNNFMSADHSYYKNNSSTDNNPYGYGYWVAAHALENLADAYQRTRNTVYRDRMKSIIAGIRKYNNYGAGTYHNDYYDDLEWLGLATFNCYNATKDPEFLDAVHQIWAEIKTGYKNGAMSWRKGCTTPCNNSIANSPAIVIAVKLYQLEGDASNLQMAKDIHAWMKANVFNANGGIWDAPGNHNEGWQFSYNSGMFIAACLELSIVTGQQSYVDDGIKACEFMMNFRNYNGGVFFLNETGQGDGGLFKGIFAKYFIEFVRLGNLTAAQKARYLQEIYFTANYAWTNAVNKSNFLISPDWSKLPSTSIDLSTEVSGVHLFESVASLNKVHVYQNINYSGFYSQLPVGNYTLAQLQARGVVDNDITSLSVPNGYTVTVYENDNFTGASKTFTANSGWLADWNDRITSLKIADAGGLVTVYQDVNYGGYSAGFDVGDYTLAQLQAKGVLDNDITSFKIPEGYKITVYDGDNFTGTSADFTGNVGWIGTDWNDKTTSLKVRTNGATNMAGIYYIQNRNSGLYMDVWGASTTDGANIAQGNYNGDANQQFQFNHLGDGTYQVLATHSMKSVEIDAIKTTDGANVQQSTYNGTPNQQFIVFPTGDGYYKLIAKHSAKVVEVANAGTANGNNIDQFTNSNQTSGQWKFVAPVAINGTGDGLTGSYFNGMNFETAKLSRKDGAVNFNWGNGSPDPSVTVDQFSARWTGQIQPRYSGIYTFYVTNDDGGRLYINNQLLIDKWRNDGGTEVTGTMLLKAGQKYDIKMEYFENGGGAKAKLEWSGLLQSREVVPTSQLYSNPAPTVLITSPANNASLSAPATVTINANASDNGSVTKVDFFNGTTLLGSDNTSPYSFAWTNVAIGTYTLTAIATDNSGAFTISAPVIVTVKQDQNIGNGDGLTGNYFNGKNFETPRYSRKDATVNFNWANGSPDASVNIDQFSARWTGQIQPKYSETYTFYVTTDDGGRLWINNQLIIDKWKDDGGTVVSGTISLTAGQKYDIKLEYYENGGGAKAILEWSSSSQARQVVPQTQLYSNALPVVTITSPANNSNSTAPANISLAVTASDADGSVSKVDYYNGTTLIASTTSPFTFAWNNVAAGTYTITAIATDNRGGVTVSAPVSVTVNAATVATVYQDCNYGGYAVSLGVGNYTMSQLVALGAKDNDLSSIKVQSGYEVILYADDNFGGASLVITSNNSCVVGNSFNDIATSLKVMKVPANNPPSVSITSPANNASFNAPASITFTANATDSDGSVSKVEFFNGSQSIGVATTSPFKVTWSNVAAGTYSITAKATDNSNAVTSSGTISITVKAVVSNNPPAVSITTPTNNATYNAPASVTFSANASDSDGSVSKVEYFNGSQSIGVATTSPYTVSWTNVAAGTYTITAKATDNSNSVTTSAAISITVKSVTTNTCSGLPQYVENGGYTDGSKVQNSGSSYQCKPYPYSGWCNGTAWAYAPGTGAYWTDAWTLVGSCTATATTPGMAVISPNPATDYITINVGESSTVTIINSQGAVVMTQAVSANGTLNISSLLSGVYSVKIATSATVITTMLSKN